jgi:hypothetical protein
MLWILGLWLLASLTIFTMLRGEGLAFAGFVAVFWLPMLIASFVIPERYLYP